MFQLLDLLLHPSLSVGLVYLTIALAMIVIAIPCAVFELKYEQKRRQRLRRLALLRFPETRMPREVAFSYEISAVSTTTGAVPAQIAALPEPEPPVTGALR